MEFVLDVEFLDAVTRRICAIKLVWGELWICWKHPEGHWVTRRRATEKDIQAVAKQVKATIPHNTDQPTAR